jgi:hypothetical protein
MQEGHSSIVGSLRSKADVQAAPKISKKLTHRSSALSRKFSQKRPRSIKDKQRPRVEKVSGSDFCRAASLYLVHSPGCIDFPIAAILP